LARGRSRRIERPQRDQQDDDRRSEADRSRGSDRRVVGLLDRAAAQFDLECLGTGLGAIGLLSRVIDTPDFSTQLAAVLGLGVGIDYAHVLARKLWLFIAVVVVLAGLLLVAVFRSIVIPIQPRALERRLPRIPIEPAAEPVGGS
jgi:hypothetical protein